MSTNENPFRFHSETENTPNLLLPLDNDLKIQQAIDDLGNYLVKANQHAVNLMDEMEQDPRDFEAIVGEQVFDRVYVHLELLQENLQRLQKLQEQAGKQ